jgi:hypothetical protein
VILNIANENYDYSTLDKLQRSFQAKREQILDANGFKTREPDEDDWRFPDHGRSYWNEYGKVFFRNMNANRDSPRAEHWFTDYYEEQP